jgi:hypothetical protein
MGVGECTFLRGEMKYGFALELMPHHCSSLVPIHDLSSDISAERWQNVERAHLLHGNGLRLGGQNRAIAQCRVCSEHYGIRGNDTSELQITTCIVCQRQ